MQARACMWPSVNVMSQFHLVDFVKSFLVDVPGAVRYAKQLYKMTSRNDFTRQNASTQRVGNIVTRCYKAECCV